MIAPFPQFLFLLVQGFLLTFDTTLPCREPASAGERSMALAGQRKISAEIAYGGSTPIRQEINRQIDTDHQHSRRRV